MYEEEGDNKGVRANGGGRKSREISEQKRKFIRPIGLSPVDLSRGAKMSRYKRRDRIGRHKFHAKEQHPNHQPTRRALQHEISKKIQLSPTAPS